MDKKLAATLQKMINEDQKAVRARQKRGVVNIHVLKTNTKKIKEIIAHYGWPTISLVGEKGSKNAWLLVQHADHDLRFQKKCLSLMLGVAKKNRKDMVLMHIAFLIDRIRVNEKKPQKFGTQFYTNKKGKFTYWPIQDIQNVDKRRAMYGIEPFAEYTKAAKSFKPASIKKIISE